MDTIIIVTPHGRVFRDSIALINVNEIDGDFSKFGEKQVKFKVEVNKALTERILKKAEENILKLLNRKLSIW